MTTQYVGVGALLVNAEGRLLLQQRDERPALFPLHWSLLGGAVEEGESPDEAMVRELTEEISHAPLVRHWRSYTNNVVVQGSVLPVTQHLFAGRIDLPLSEIPLLEGKALGFFARDEVEELPMAFGFERVVKEYLCELEEIKTT